MTGLTIIGGGLAGCEAAWQAAQRGVDVVLVEMRPGQRTPAHQTDRLAELVCSNSLGSALPDRAPGVLKNELGLLGSLILSCAQECAVPAGGALAVDREAFAALVTAKITAHPRITVVREAVTRVPREGLTLVATGPLTSPELAADLAVLSGQDQLYFYDAMAPIVTADSIDMSIAFRAARYGRGEDDYINCPLDAEQYARFVRELVHAERMPLRDFEREDPRFFEACLPIEVLAERDERALAYGPLRPVGLTDPRTGRRPFAVVQLRQDNLAGTLYNLVGFQTNLRWGEQQRVFGLIPGLEHAEWVRFGQMHRNTFLNAPRLLRPTLQWRERDDLLFGGQITGTEGYVGSTASGLVAGLNAARLAQGLEPVTPPPTTMLGALLRYVTTPQGTAFQPMKPNMGLLPPLDRWAGRKRDRNAAYAERALRDMAAFASAYGLPAEASV
ncbi:MAG: methylenetetrahydrofolate--tRNA-(uracil(54)-C(5))-methyltransferase (FADH(2)-oxidizing) TrmFO [Anaerolineales bacterium]